MAAVSEKAKTCQRHDHIPSSLTTHHNPLTNLQLTVSSASADETLACMLLVSTHLYRPSSVRFRLVMVREEEASVLSSPVWLTVSLELEATSSLLLSKNHSTVDDGLPSYWQLRVTLSLSNLVIADGELEILGGSERVETHTSIIKSVRLSPS